MSSPRADEFQRRHPWAAVPLAVVYKFIDDQGTYLAALMAYYGLLSVFPLLLVATTVFGYVLQGHPGLEADVLRSAATQIPVIGPKLLADPHGYKGSGTGLAVGLLGGLYGGTGVAQAAQNAMNQIYAVPRNERPNQLKGRLRSLGLLLTLGVGLLLTTGVSALTSTATAHVPGLRGHALATAVISFVLTAGLDVVIFVVAFRVLTARDLSVRDVALGAVIAALAWEVLQLLGGYVIQRKLTGSDQVYGTFAVVLGLIAYIYLVSLVVVLCVELNVVVGRHLWPRSLLTPFADDVDLTSADRRAYTSYAKAQRHKSFEHVDVGFDSPSVRQHGTHHESQHTRGRAPQDGRADGVPSTSPDSDAGPDDHAGTGASTDDASG